MAQLQKLQFLSVLLLSSCSIFDQFEDTYEQRFEAHNVVTIQDLQSTVLRDAEVPKVSPVVAVYPTAFTDQTGQRKSNSEFALFSTAITQQPNALLIRALKHAGNGNFFRVVERVGLDNLTKERQLIRSTRESFEEDSSVKPLLLAGLLVQGGVLSYDSNVKSGGLGARLLGIGSSKEYREDLITISLRLVSVSTGEVLIEVLVSKTVTSAGISQDIFRFLDEGQRLVEVEGGVAENESTSIALQRAIEEGVLEIIKTGITRGYWEYEEIN